MDLAQSGTLKDKLFAAMAQTDCTACGWDCEGYAAALASGETKDITLCVPGEQETESKINHLIESSNSEVSLLLFAGTGQGCDDSRGDPRHL